MRRVSRFLTLLLLVSLGLTGCGKASGAPEPTALPEAQESPAAIIEAEPGVVRLASTDSMGTMDVHRNTADYLIPLNVFETLFYIRVNEDGATRLANGLAEDWSVSDDGLTYRFTLRPDAFFSDGTPVKASDVAFTFTRMLALPGSLQTDFADMIRGAEAVMNGEASTLEGIRVLDDRNLEITLSEPYAGYLTMLATPSCCILSEKHVTAAGNAYGSDAAQVIGSGPYMITEAGKDRVVLERNPYYHCLEDEVLTVSRAEVLLTAPALVDRMFRNGELDLLDLSQLNPEVVKTVYKTGEWDDSIIAYSRMEVQYLMLNLETPPLNDVRIRKAVQMAINRQRILDDLFNGDARLLDGIYPRGLVGFCEENQGWLQYDPEEAARLVSEVPGAADARLELAVNSQSSIRTLRMMEMIREDLEAVGLSVSTVSYDEDSRMYLRRAGKLMAYNGEWSADFNDPDNFIYTLFGSREKTRARSGNFADEAVMARIAAARSIQDEDERMAEYAELERILVRDEAVWVPILSTEHLFVLGDRLENFTPFWAGWGNLYLKDIVLKPEAR